VGVSEGFRKIIEDAVQANLINMAFNKSEAKEGKELNVMVPPSKKTCC
jgi:hypothetical protein